MHKDIRLKFGLRLRSLRHRYGMTQRELAEKSGVALRYIQNLEGKNPKAVTIVTQEKIAKGFGMSYDKLCDFK